MRYVYRIGKTDLAHHGAEIDDEKALDVEERLAFRLLEAEVDLRRLEAPVDRDGDRSEQRRAMEKRQPWLVVPHQDPGPVAVAESHGLHLARSGARLVQHLAVREAAGLGHQRLGVRRALREHLAQRPGRPAHGLPIPLPEASCASIAISSR